MISEDWLMKLDSWSTKAINSNQSIDYIVSHEGNVQSSLRTLSKGLD